MVSVDIVVIFVVHYVSIVGLFGARAVNQGDFEVVSSSDVGTKRDRSRPPPKRLVHLTFMHRHGARQPPIIGEDDAITWEYAMLTKVGAKMAENLGRFLNRRYANTKVASINKSLPYANQEDVPFIPTVRQAFVSASSVYSLSTSDDARCTQTGQGVALNFVGDVHSVSSAPFFNAIPETFDFILNFNDNYPSQSISKYNYNYCHNNSVVKNMFTEMEFKVLHRYVPGGMDTCNEAGEMTCALLARDVAQCLQSNIGWSPGHEQLEELYPKLQHLQALRCNALFGYNPIEAPVDNLLGSSGYIVAKDIILKAEKAFIAYQNEDVAAPPRINHLSAHDDTITGLVVALGAVSGRDTSSAKAIELWVPAFAQVNAMEVHPNGNMSFWWAYPNQTYNSGYEYPDIDKVWPLEITCKSAEGNIYRASECPIADLSRFLKDTQPKIHTELSDTLSHPLIAREVLGMGVACYLMPEQREKCEQTWFLQDTLNSGLSSIIMNHLGTIFGADGAESDITTLTEAECRRYLSDCPIEACGPGYAPAPQTTLISELPNSETANIDVATPYMGRYYDYYHCIALVPTHDSKSSASKLRLKLIGIGIPIAVGVFVMSIIVGATLKVFTWNKQKNGYIDMNSLINTEDGGEIISDN